MSEDVDGGSGNDGVEVADEYLHGWDEPGDFLNLTTESLNELLAENDMSLDYQLFRQNDQLDFILRKELNFLTQSISSSNSKSQVQSWSDDPEDKIATTKVFFTDDSMEYFRKFKEKTDYSSSSLLEGPTSLLNTLFLNPTSEFQTVKETVLGPTGSKKSFSNFSLVFTDSSEVNINYSASTSQTFYIEESFINHDTIFHINSEKSMYIIILLSILVFLFLITLVLFLLRYKNVHKCRSRDAELPLRSSGHCRKSGDSRFLENRRNSNKERTLSYTVVEMTSTTNHQVSIIGSSISKQHQRSNLILSQDQEPSLLISAAPHIPTCISFPSHSCFIKTSPEERSTNWGAEEEGYDICQAQDGDVEKNDFSDKRMEEISKIITMGNNFNKRRISSSDDDTGEVVSLHYIDYDETEEAMKEKETESSMTSLSTFCTKSFHEDGSCDEGSITGDFYKKIAENIDLGQELCKQKCIDNREWTY